VTRRDSLAASLLPILSDKDLSDFTKSRMVASVALAMSDQAIIDALRGPALRERLLHLGLSEALLALVTSGNDAEAERIIVGVAEVIL
jgi:hypothetical protein